MAAEQIHGAVGPHQVLLQWRKYGCFCSSHFSFSFCPFVYMFQEREGRGRAEGREGRGRAEEREGRGRAEGREGRGEGGLREGKGGEREG